jgi:predicted ATP-dependent protease
LRTREIKIESVAEALDLSAGVSQEPEPVPFAGKVILIGEPWLYRELCARDPEFEELFKVAADFESDIDRSPQSTKAYAQLLGQVAKREQLKPFHKAAIARLLEEASRRAEDAHRYSMHMRAIFDLLREADHWAASENHSQVLREDVERAIAQRDLRYAGTRERMLRYIEQGTIRVETSGSCVGQLNGLSVIDLGESSFGFPTRITARARLGKGEVVDVQREVKLSGPIHSKGVLILSAFVGGRYQVDRPLSLHATLVFEQTYGGIDGDSASLAELLALLSAVGQLPARQSLAITGSVDQHGNVQAVGGLNEKIEGMFAVCSARGLDGSQGVIIPKDNIRHLMLREPVRKAVENKQFSIWGVDHVDQAMELLFGIPAGERVGGVYPPGTANHLVDTRLSALHETTLELARASMAASTPSPKEPAPPQS